MSKKPLLLLLSAVVTMSSGCGGGSSTTTETRTSAQPLIVNTNSLPSGIVGSPYAATLGSTGGTQPVSWSVSGGALPAGLNLAAAGQISGTPTAPGIHNFTVKATDSGIPAQSTTAPLSITITDPPLRITSFSLPVGAMNSAYSATLLSSGGKPPVTWRVTIGTLPLGLNLNAATGQISGIATTAGPFSFSVQATDSNAPAQTATQGLSITINPPLSIATSTLPNGAAAGCAYSAMLESSGGTPPVAWTISMGTLPVGLALSATGEISGSPTTVATSNFTVQAKDSSTPVQMASKDLSLTVTASPQGGCWRKAGAMSSARAGHTATLLRDGRVLIAGQGTATAELYSPANGSWTPTGNMSVGRSGHTATRLDSGKILVAGGSAPDGRFDSSGYTAELYDAVMGTWTLTGSMNVARAGHTAVLLLDGTVLAVGGTSTSPCNPFCAGGHTTELYDPNSGAWSRTHDIMITGRTGGLTATRLSDGRVLVAGGSSGGFPLSNAELYDPTTRTWANTGSMGVARSGHTATLLKNGKVLAVGGLDHCQHDDLVDWCVTTASAEVYDPATGTWTRVAQMKTGRFFQTATLLNDGKVLVAGGAGDGFWGPAPFAIAEVYDPVADTWISTANSNMHSARSNHTATLLNDGKVLVTGGVAEVRWEQSCGDLGCQDYPVFIYSASAETYDPGP